MNNGYETYFRKFRMLMLVIFLLSGNFVFVLRTNNATAENPDPFFYISILAPNTNPARNQWATLMVDQLPKIGIGIDIFDHTGWSQISPRTWGYPGPYPIPSYSEGGYDMLFVGWSWEFDWTPRGLFDSSSITPNGDNFYQYDSQAMDDAIDEYETSFVLGDRIHWLEEIQDLLYEDVPEASIVYPLNLYPMDANFDKTSWSGLLWSSSQQSMENWTIPGQSEFHYATPADFEDFHIYKANSIFDKQWLHQIYNGLVERNPLYSNGYYPRIAQSFSSTDGLTYNVALKSGVKWADGEELNTTDIQYSYNLQITPDFGSPKYAYWTQYIDNSSVSITSATECEITFKKLFVFQDSNLALDLVPKHIWNPIDPLNHEVQAVTWAADDVLDSQKIIGAGPYKLEDYDGTNDVIHLSVNEYFDDWSGITPKFDDIYFNFYSNKEGALSALAAGTIDMVDAMFSTRIAEVPAGTTYALVEDPGVQELAFNCEHPIIGTGELCPISSPESGKAIRQAISHMIPREAIVNEILDGLGTPGVTACPSIAVGFDESLEPYEYDIELAKQCMEAAGYVYNDTTPTLTTTPPTLTIGMSFIITLFSFTIVIVTYYVSKRKKN